MTDVLIIGAGIGGLTLALCLHKRGIPARVHEAAPEIRPIGAGLNLLPHAVAELAELGLAEELERVSVVTSELVFFNRFGQRIYAEPAGRAAGHAFPQLSLHRGELQSSLLNAAEARLGADRIQLGWRCTGTSESGAGVRAEFVSATGETLPPQAGSALIGCDGIHSTIRRHLYPSEGEPIYSGVNMWRGVTRGPRFLSGASMVRAGWLATGKMVIYPIRDRVDAEGNQLINWVAELETPNYRRWEWNRPGNIDDFIAAFADWQFDWLDVPAMLRSTEPILEYPMVDKDPLPRWSFGCVSLLGDAAHPLYPRGSNGAVQAILDARALADCLAGHKHAGEALDAYQRKRLPATTEVVLASRSRPPDVILREVYERTGDRPFARIEDVVSAEELARISNAYKRVSGYARDQRDPS